MITAVKAVDLALNGAARRHAHPAPRTRTRGPSRCRSNASRGDRRRDRPARRRRPRPPSATGAAATPTSPSRSAAPRPARPSPSPTSRRWLRAQGKLAEVPLRERVWQQLARPPRGTGRRPACARAALCSLVHDRPDRLAGGERRLRRAPRRPAARPRSTRCSTRFGPGARARPSPPRRPPAAPPAPLLRGAAELAAGAGRPQGLRVPARPPPGRQPAAVHLTPDRPRRADGRTRRPRPHRPRPRLRHRNPARAAATATARHDRSCTARTATPNWPPSPRCASP